MQITLYIRKGIQDQFKNEPDKSALVNELLSAHYGTQKRGVIGKVEGVVVDKITRAKGTLMGPPEQETPETPQVPSPEKKPAWEPSPTPPENLQPTRQRVKRQLRRRSDLI